MLEEDNQVYEFIITIKEIKLAVKFPCKLSVNYQNRTIKSDVTADEAGKYLIERQVKTKSQNGEAIQVLIHLTTDKGGNIMAGIIKLVPRDLSVSQGQTINLNLQKCLDQSASCLIKIDRVWHTRNNKAKSMAGQFSSRNRKNYVDEGIGSSKKLPPTIVDNYRNAETRSQFPGFNLKKPIGIRKQNGFQGYNLTNKLHGLGPKSYVPEVHMVRSKNIDRSMQFRKQGVKFRMDDDNKTVGKRQIDPSYKLTVEANQKNLKMDIMKYKMKSEEHEKTIEQKNRQIKQLKQQISQLHRQSVQKNFYQEEINSKNQMIQKFQDTSKSLSKQNSRLQSRIIELQRGIQEAKSNLQSAIQKAKDEKQRREMEFSKELNLRKDDITLMNDELKSKNNQITRIKKIIEDLQKSLQSKTFDYEKSIQGQRSAMNKLEVLLNDKIKQLEQMNKSSTLERQNLNNELQKRNQQIQKLQSNANHLMTQVKEVTELQKYYAQYKNKYTELQKSFQKLDEEKMQVQKHYLKLLQSKQKDLGQFKDEQSSLITSYKKKNGQLTEKSKQHSARILQLENRTVMMSADIDKLRRNLELAQKQLGSLTQTQKSLNLSVKQKDAQLLTKHKQLSELQSKLSTRQTMLKKEIDYKSEQLSKVSAKLSQQQHLYRQQKQNNQNLRFQGTKLEGKIKLQEEIMSRLNRQIEETKVHNEKREQEFKDQIKEMNEKIKLYELMEKKFNKQITQYQMQDLNRKNQISRLTKQLEIRGQKLERQIKKNQQHELVNKQLNESNKILQHKLANTENDLKELQNNKRSLEADFNKTQKIKTIIVQEKTTVQNQLVNLKKQIGIKVNKEQQLNKQVKQLKQQLTRMTLRANNSAKDFQNFKENLYTTIQSAFYTSNGKSFSKGFNLTLDFNRQSQQIKNMRANSNSFTNINQIITPRTGINRLHDSQFMNYSHEQKLYEPRFNQIIEQYGRESQQIIQNFNDTIRKNKSQIQRLQRQSSNLSSRLQSTEQQGTQAIASLQKQIQSLNSKHQESHNKWEQKFMLSERAHRQKQQMIEQLNDELESVNHQLAANARTHQIQIEQLGLKMEQLKGKIYDLDAKNDFSNMTILGYQEKTFAMQSSINQLEQQLDFERQKITRKDKLIVEHSSEIDELTKLLQENKKQKLQLNRDLLATKQKLESEKQVNQKHRKLLEQEEQKNKQIKGFNTNLIKEKQNIVKNQIQKSQKVIELEDYISRMKIQRDDLLLEIDSRQKNLAQLRAQIKRQNSNVKQLDTALQRQSHEVQKLIEANKEKQKRLQQRDLEIKNLEINLQKLMSKYEQDTKKLNQQIEETMSRFTRQLEQKKSKILEFTNQIQKLNHLQKKLSEQNISLEEQIFFEKQTNSLSSSRFDTMGRGISDLQSKLTQAIRQIDTLNDQIRDRQEKLFDLSNKLYGLDSKLQMKQIQMRQKLEKLDFDWKNKYEQTLQDYQAKLQSYERQKHYLRGKLQQEMEEISKLENQKRAIIIEDQTDKRIFEDKIKKMETQKLALLVDKNKEIEKLRHQIELKQDRIKQIKHEKDIRQDDIRRLQQKVREKQQRLSLQQEKNIQALSHLEKQLEFQKKKQSQLKKYKEFIKNNLWSSQRQIKRILQSYIKNIMILCQEQKKKDVIDIMKNVEGQIVKAIQFNLQQA